MIPYHNCTEFQKYLIKQYFGCMKLDCPHDIKSKELEIIRKKTAEEGIEHLLKILM